VPTTCCTSATRSCARWRPRATPIDARRLEEAKSNARYSFTARLDNTDAIAGTLARSGFAEVAWQPRPAVEIGLELKGQGRLPVNDVNSDFAGGFGLLALRAQWRLNLGAGRLDLLARIDNLADRRVAGSVIVNEGNSRFFEPAPGRSGLISARWSAPF
jgi:iron complex outermembrane receptor protein